MKPAFHWDDPLEIELGRNSDEMFSLYQANGKAAQLDPAAVIRFKLAAKPEDVTPLLDISSVTPLTGGSLVTIVGLGTLNTSPAKAQVHFGANDTLALEPGDDYFGELIVVDATGPRRAAYGAVVIKPSPGGHVGLTP